MNFSENHKAIEQRWRTESHLSILEGYHGRITFPTRWRLDPTIPPSHIHTLSLTLFPKTLSWFVVGNFTPAVSAYLEGASAVELIGLEGFHDWLQTAPVCRATERAVNGVCMRVGSVLLFGVEVGVLLACTLTVSYPILVLIGGTLCVHEPFLPPSLHS